MNVKVRALHQAMLPIFKQICKVQLGTGTMADYGQT